MKEIIIDGVNVAECDNGYTGWSDLHRDTRRMCEDRTECNPKEYQCGFYVKYLEQENEKLKEENQKYWKEIRLRQDDEAKAMELANEYILKEKICKQALEEIRANILLRYSIDKNKEIIASPLEDLWCIKKLIDEVLK